MCLAEMIPHTADRLAGQGARGQRSRPHMGTRRQSPPSSLIGQNWPDTGLLLVKPGQGFVIPVIGVFTFPAHATELLDLIAKPV